ncbi:hypothetical protein EG68_07216 [Paragonimus skrjabini miyazakii]|uniref:Uncharacterized protein n=1 Tax=Paragonimus skrjabini miyazakii TaxID=59628 RepID=A0A8S9YCX9_9TREM|nr:hypothetical protein EG68_07216 [Paragonimus skrjabini miyazakii]
MIYNHHTYFLHYYNNRLSVMLDELIHSISISQHLFSLSKLDICHGAFSVIESVLE